MAQIPDIKVTIEQAIHKTVADLLQKIADEYGIRIEQISARWIDASTVGEDRAIVREVELQTLTKVRR